MKLLFNLIIALCLVSHLSLGQSDAELVDQTISKRTIEGHIYFLASDEFKGRQTGSPELDIAAQYLATTLQRYGVTKVPGADGYFQPVIMKSIKPASDLKITLGDQQLESTDNIIPLTAQVVDMASEIVFVGYGFDKDYENKEVKGKIVVVLGGNAEKHDANSMFQMSSAKRVTATKFGAKGLIELGRFAQAQWKSMAGFLLQEKFGLSDQTSAGMPHIWLRDTDGKIAEKVNTSKKLTVDIEINGGENEQVISKNVVGMVEGTDPKLKNEFIIYSAHYDHVGIGKPNAEGDSIYNGARDNAVGVVTVLSAAESIARKPTKRSALFILFTGEEKGLLGSKWYAAHPLIPMNQMVYCFNSDNASYNDTSVATIVGLNRTTASENIKKACKTFGLQALDDPAPEQNLFDRSDNVNFAKLGVPAPTFSLGFTAFDAEVFKYYHKVTDNPESLDYDYLLKFFKSYVLSCRLIANDAQTPFWVDGDKYYEAGNKLYNK